METAKKRKGCCCCQRKKICMIGDFLVREAEAPETEPALHLAWETFQEFVAPHYTQDGIEEFRRFISPESIREMTGQGEMALWSCWNGEGNLVGTLGTRASHICLLFIQKEHQRKGAARALVEAWTEQQKEQGASHATVHAFPNATEAYRRLGFLETGPEETRNGMRFVPMSLNIL